MADTLLVISPNGIPPYSARGLKQKLEPIDGTKVTARTVNGTLIDLSPTQMRKFKSTITCQDQNPPAFDGLWPGMIVTVDCVKELSYLTAGGAPSRTVVSGSSRVDGDFTFYRPQLTMMVMAFTDTLEEWQAVEDWQLDLEEV